MRKELLNSNHNNGFFELQSPREYLRDTMMTIDSAGRDAIILSRSMNIDVTEADTAEFLESLKRASKRDAAVELILDNLTHLSSVGEVSLLPFDWGLDKAKLRRLKEITSTSLESLRNSNISITFISPPDILGKIFTVMGRSHMKGTVVMNGCHRAAWIGGQNLDNFKKIDFMIKTTDTVIVAALYDILSQKFDTGFGEDYVMYCNDNVEIYVDSGKRFRSAIYDSAVDLTRKATETYVFASQLQPDGPLLDEIEKLSKKGVDVKIFLTNEDSNFYTKPPYSFFYNNFRKRIKGHPSIELIHTDRYLHAKLILVDGEGDQAEGMTGSHNFVLPGVRFGTREISARVKGEHTKPLHAFVQNLYQEQKVRIDV